MIKILGAGISGLTSAIKLAKAGVDVTVFEKLGAAGGMGDSVQAIRNYEHDYDQWEYFGQNGISIKHANPIYNIIKYAPSGRKMCVHSERGKPLFYALMRGPDAHSIESQLCLQAKSLGVNFVYNSKTDLRESDADIISVGGIYNNITAYGAVYADANIDKETILFFMDNRYCPKGYIYVIPYGNKVTMAATTFDAECQLPKLFEKFINENLIIKEMLTGATFVNNFSGFEYSNIPRTAVVNNRKITGSAAGFVDPSRGFGIKYAILSGMAAAQSLAENKDYDALWKAMFEKELLEGFKRRLMLEEMDNNDYEKFILGEKINIAKYDKYPASLRDRFMKISFAIELEKNRRKYNLAKYFQGAR